MTILVDVLAFPEARLDAPIESWVGEAAGNELVNLDHGTSRYKDSQSTVKSILVKVFLHPGSRFDARQTEDT